jgi:ferredoxin-NADP reductase
MYRLVLYYLILLVVAGLGLSIFGSMPFSPFALAFSCAFLVIVGLITNKIFALVFEVPANVESVYISALILTLIITPVKSLHDFAFLFWAAVLTMASKFIVAINKRHIFNPVALAVAITAVTINGSATWWVGSLPMLPFVLLGIFVVIKVRRFDMLFYFFLVYLISLFGFDVLAGANPVITLQKSLTDSPLLFFSFIMLTEPITTPPTKTLQSIYGGLIGLLMSPKFHIGSVFITPEMALIGGNIFSYLVSPKYKLIMTLKEKIKLSDDIYDFVFTPDRKFNFIAGQYMEWTYGHPNTDDRGNRRYFTLANSPTESDIRLGVKFYRQSRPSSAYQNSSSYKMAMLNMKVGEKITAGNLMGDFILPKDMTKKLVFVAGGIGVTPFRSILKYMIDTKEKRDIVLLYTDKTQNKFVYRDIFEAAMAAFGLKVLYVATEESGHADGNYIMTYITDYLTRTFYVSGSNRMVKGFEDILKSINVPKNQVVTDFFPGLM